MNSLALLAAVRHTCLVRPERLAAAAFLGAFVSSIAALFEFTPIFTTSLSLLCVPVMLAVAGVKRRGLACASAALLSVSAFMACAVRLSPWNGRTALILAGVFAAIAAVVIDSGKRRWLTAWEARIRLATGNAVTYIDALIDTGNHLYEPISGLSVMPVSEKLLYSILPEGFSPARAAETLPAGFRLIGYGGVGGVGEMGCFMPERIEILQNGRWHSINSVWIAVYPGILPGGADALMPPGIT